MKYREIHINYNSFQIQHKKPFGAVLKDQEIQFSLTVEYAMNPEVTFVVSKEGQGEQYIKMSSLQEGSFTTSYSSSEYGLCFYFFMLNYDDHGMRRTVYLGAPSQGIGGEILCYIW